MAKVSVKATLIAMFVLFIILELSEARRGGGGGFRGGRSYRSSRIRSSSRMSSRTRYTYRSKYSAYRLSSKSSIRNAVLLGTIYGATRWKLRRSYRIDSSRLPEICYNDNYVKSDTGNVSYYGRFVCPLDDTMGNDYSYCCGDEGKQFCCRFMDNGGRAAGVVIAIIVATVAIFVLFYCMYKHFEFRNRGSHRRVFKSGSHNSGLSKGFTSKSEYSAVYSPPHQLQTNATQPAGYTSDPVMRPAPPSYDSATANGALPYDVNPDGYKAPLPTNDTSDGLPYPINPQAGYPPAGNPPTAYPPPGGPSAPPYPIN